MEEIADKINTYPDHDVEPLPRAAESEAMKKVD
jgi:hypothetical protein